jgi:hypothetical protein
VRARAREVFAKKKKRLCAVTSYPQLRVAAGSWKKQLEKKKRLCAVTSYPQHSSCALS